MKLNITKYLLLVLILAGIWMIRGDASAGEIDILVQKLVEKGILTPAEAQTLLAETKQEVKTQMARGRLDTLPEWLQRITFKGDFRLREQYQKRDQGEDRWRTRIRARLGLEAMVNERARVGIGIATGQNDPRSTNLTLSDSEGADDIKLDFAYGQYMLTDWMTFTGGKFKNPIWTSYSDLVWDTDLNPEGAAAQFAGTCGNWGWFVNTGYIVLDEHSNSGDDPFMLFIQPGFDYFFNEKTNVRVAGIHYNTTHTEGNILDYSSKTNTDATTGLAYEYDLFGATAQLNMLTVHPRLPYTSLFADYIYNTDPDDDETGWLVGFALGEEKVKEKGQWQLRYNYRKLERDAVLDILPDSDFFGGATNVKGHEGVLEYGISRNMSLVADYYRSEEDKGDVEEDLFQLDWNLKF